MKMIRYFISSYYNNNKINWFFSLSQKSACESSERKLQQNYSLWTAWYAFIAFKIRHIGVGAIRMMAKRIGWDTVLMWHAIRMHWLHAIRIVAVHLKS